MQRLNLTLPTPAENLALDEALLDWAEEENDEWEFVRLWESPAPIVVVGRSTRVGREVHESTCRELGIPILRRSSGGAAIVAGPGCLMYGLVLSYKLRPELKDIGRAHAHVLGRLAASLKRLGLPVAHAGTSDLTLAAGSGAGEPPAPPRLKFSGNSLRAKRSHLLYHGTLLYGFDLPLIGACLRMPPRVPDYRAGRAHREFVVNLPIARQALVEAVDATWLAGGTAPGWPRERVARLVTERFGCESWNFEFR